MYDLQQGDWSHEILGTLGLDPARLSLPLEAGTPVGKMKADLARELGFKDPPLVVCGGHDQSCGVLGVGLTHTGLAEVSTGTAEVVEVAVDLPAVNRRLFEGNISVYKHTAPGLYVAMTLNHSGGMLLRWFRDTFCQNEISAARSGDTDAYDLILAVHPPNPPGCMCCRILPAAVRPPLILLPKVLSWV